MSVSGNCPLLSLNIILGDKKLTLKSPQVDIIARYFGHERYEHISEIFFLGGNVSLGRLYGTTHAAKQIEFPGCVKIELKEIAFQERAGDSAIC
jgi:hypothetical protein